MIPGKIRTEDMVIAGRIFPGEQIAQAVVAMPRKGHMVMADLHKFGCPTASWSPVGLIRFDGHL
ncbi:hypothetical protein [Kitasatospora mediocidica]|uniref:hypothetical protein n=1 Tax=Kitasatospora mediocidica TaxID=58352 RepID=UPI000560647C|nr:hypothetical protein [Kitasatospora mediocidica]